MYNLYNNYNKSPEIVISGYEKSAFNGYTAITDEIKRRIGNKKKTVIVFESYPGTYIQEILNGISELSPSICINSENCMVDCNTYQTMIQDNLTDDRVFGMMNVKTLSQFFVTAEIEKAKTKINSLEDGIAIVYGVGATLITQGDILIYCDMARWEIQNRFKSGMPNYHSNNSTAPFLTKYKQGFFVEWRIADKHKKKLFDKIDYLLDSNIENQPNMISGEAFRHGLEQTAQRPFRLVPYFDPGVWGGQWLKAVCDLPKEKSNYAWSFDGVPEENSLYFRFGDVRVEIPAIDLVFYQPHELLGERVHARFGDEFPIRFDLLDTMEGGNLSLQVHPSTEYIQNTFGMHYTQDESYYILDCSEDAYVYLGLKEKICPEDMIQDLKDAQSGNKNFDVEKYVNKLPVKKHEHILIPSGTIHCSGANTMVLEISSTPYIFTFKLWDWGRLGLDGLPRPVHIEHGEQVIQWERTTSWVENNLINQVVTLNENDDTIEEQTGLHEREFIETRRHKFRKEVIHESNGSVNVLNLVGGEEAEVFSPDNIFEPFVVHYAETFIVPASIKKYGIRNTVNSQGQELITIKAYVR